MTPRLVIALETALAGLAQEFHKDASVLVQFAAGHFHELKEALAEAKAQMAAPVTPAPAQPPAPQGAPVPPEGGDAAGKAAAPDTSAAPIGQGPSSAGGVAQDGNASAGG